MNIYLIGYRCSGKTVIARTLASRTRSFFFDTDEQITRYCNMTITRIVKEYGWSYFRSKEREVLLEASLKKKCIVATGGGIILDSNNIILMKKTGIVIWLKAEIGAVKRWILADYKTPNFRPSLTGKKLMEDVEETFNLRLDAYRSASNFSISTHNFNPYSICEQILFHVSQNFSY